MTIQWAGAMWPDRILEKAPQIGNFVVLGGQIFNDQFMARLKERGLKIVLQVGFPAPEFLFSVPHIEHQLRQIEIRLKECGVWGQLVGMMFSEENYLHLLHGTYDSWPQMQSMAGWSWEQKANAFRDIFDQAYQVVKRMWPHVYTIHLEPYFAHEKNHSNDTNYRPPLWNVDFYAIDAYCPAPITRENWDFYVKRLYQASARYGKPLIAVVQTFQDHTGLWSQMPTTEQLGWNMELFNQLPVVAVMYFCLEHPSEYDNRHAPGMGLTQFAPQFNAIKTWWEGRI